MSVYLVHEPILNLINFCYYGKISKSGQIDGKPLHYLSHVVPWFPLWAIPIHFFGSIIVGTILTLYIEEPARKYLKNKLL